jgi:hypothetical protein
MYSIDKIVMLKLIVEKELVTIFSDTRHWSINYPSAKLI